MIKKRIYTIFSLELKRKVREIIFPFGTSDKGNDQYQGKNSQGDSISYQRGKDGSPDKLILIDRKDFGNEEIIYKTEQQSKIERRKEEDGWENWDVEWERAEALWKKTENESGITSAGTRHYFSGRNSDRKIVMEGIYIKSENQPLIQEIAEKQENNKENFTQQEQALPRK